MSALKELEFRVYLKGVISFDNLKPLARFCTRLQFWCFQLPLFEGPSHFFSAQM